MGSHMNWINIDTIHTQNNVNCEIHDCNEVALKWKQECWSERLYMLFSALYTFLTLFKMYVL